MLIISDNYKCRHFGCSVVCNTKLGRAYHEQLNHPHITNMYDVSMDYSKTNAQIKETDYLIFFIQSLVIYIIIMITI